MNTLNIIETTTTTLTVMSRTLTTSIHSMKSDLGDIPEQIIAEIEKNGLNIAGPCQFIYTGSMETHDTPFTLQVAFPVSDFEKYTGPFHIGQLAAKSFYQSSYTGHLDNIGEKGWMPFMEALGKDMKPGKEAREVYIDWKGPESSENVVLLQFEK